MKEKIRQHRLKLDELYLAAQAEYERALEHRSRASQLYEGSLFTSESLRRNSSSYPRGNPIAPPPAD